MNMSTALGRLLPLAVSSLLVPGLFAQAPMSIGNLAVLRSGDGIAPLTGDATPSFLEEWDPAGTFTTPVQPDIAIPTTAVGPQFACTNSGTSTSEGQLNLSTNGLYLTWGGYDAPLGTLGVAEQANPPVARVIGRFSVFTGTLDTSTAITDAYSPTPTTTGPVSGNIRGVVSDDGNRFWTTSPVFNTTGGGVRFVANLGDLTSTLIAAGNIRHIGIYHGDLFVTQNSGGIRGVAQVGSGSLPTSAAGIALLNGFPSTSGPSSYDMFWANPSTVYVADDRIGSSGGGIQKWTETGGVWSLQYTLTLGLSAGCRTVTGKVLNGVTTLYGIANSGSTTQIITVTDTGPASVVTSLRTAPTNMLYRGIRFIDKPTSLQRVSTPCGPRTIDIVCTGTCELGTDQFTKVRGIQGFGGLIALDVSSTFVNLNVVPFLPLCDCVLGVSVNPVGIIGANNFTLSVAPFWATLGLQVYIQGIDYAPPTPGCPELTLDLSDTYVFTVQ